ncbi:MAG TPA: hypothetical protein VML54_13535 [Candidatus Limnocylindrales bacterium]|nr:hypothetical protein [Candidatus Limnocylindrales bacterium]
MPKTDRYGLTLSTESSVAAERYQGGMDDLLAYGPDADRAFADARAADERFALAHAGTALFVFLQGDGVAAREAIGRARDVAAGATRREQQHVEALATVMAGDATRGLALIEEHLREFPRDALLLNQASSTIGFSGRGDREQARADFVERLAPAYGDDWWYQSALAFTYHELGRYAESQRLSELSLAQYPRNANASHNIAHVYFEAADNDGGAAFLEDWLRDYDRRAPFHCHLAWHLALFELHRGRAERAYEIAERDVVRSASARLSMIDGAAILWRFSLYGAPAGPFPWAPLAELASRVSRPGFVFGDVHAALAYASTGDAEGLARLVDGLRGLEAKGHPCAGTVALPLVLGTQAFVAGDHAGALAHFEPVEKEMHRVGGSHAQWELFEETMVVSYLKLGRQKDAERLLRRRIAHRPSPRDLVWLGESGAAPKVEVTRG